jgi:pimeloyl-ACP methyl ester carboxylesterase
MHLKNRTILLIPGLWMAPNSWGLFRGLYEKEGYRVLAPAWPHMHGSVEDIRRDPVELGGMGLGEIADYYAEMIDELEEAPILIGHSMGGLIVQMLLSRGLGGVGIAIDSATPKGIYRLPWSTLKANRRILSNPLNYWRPVTLTFGQFRYAFAHVMPEREARAAYEAYVVPGPGRPIFQVATGNFNPWAANRVNFRKHDRAPLLLIAGEKDRLVPAVLTRSNFHLYRHSTALTAFKEFPGRSHLLIAQVGWEEVAEYALTWAVNALAADARPTLSLPVPKIH